MISVNVRARPLVPIDHWEITGESLRVENIFRPATDGFVAAHLANLVETYTGPILVLLRHNIAAKKVKNLYKAKTVVL